MVSLGVGVGLALVGAAVVWVAGGRLESASERLGAHYGLPAVVQGAVIAAVGSSFPATTRTGDGKVASGPCEAFARKSPEHAA